MNSDTTGVIILAVGCLAMISISFAYLWRELNNAWPDDDTHLGELDE